MDVPAAQHGWRAVESTADARAGSTAKVYFNRCHPFCPPTHRGVARAFCCCCSPFYVPVRFRLYHAKRMSDTAHSSTDIQHQIRLLYDTVAAVNLFEDGRIYHRFVSADIIASWSILVRPLRDRLLPTFRVVGKHTFCSPLSVGLVLTVVLLFVGRL